MTLIDRKMCMAAIGVDIGELIFHNLGVASSTQVSKFLTFLEDKKYASELNRNINATGVLVSAENASYLDNRFEKIIVTDPKWCFFTLLNALAISKIHSKSVISKEAKIHDSAVISSCGVIVEEGVLIEPNAVVMSGVTIRRGTIIRAGAVIGVDGFEHKRTQKGILTVVHDGQVLIEELAEVGPCCTVNKGFSYRNTIIGKDCKLDAQVHYAHGVQSGMRCFIAASAVISGHVTLGDDVWVGPGSVISNRISVGNGAFITIGSVVIRNVGAGQKVTGNFALPHSDFLKHYINTMRRK